MSTPNNNDDTVLLPALQVPRAKQVIVVRKDLKLHKEHVGKFAGQVAHACMKDLLHKWTSGVTPDSCTEEEKSYYLGIFTKIVVGVDSEAELNDIYEKAKLSGLNVHMIVDKGLTVFKGVPTKTCLAIGPHYPEKLDPITGHLKLIP
jgi:PTH2 family peptidyl-tRNA hydrolase